MTLAYVHAVLIMDRAGLIRARSEPLFPWRSWSPSLPTPKRKSLFVSIGDLVAFDRMGGAFLGVSAGLL